MCIRDSTRPMMKHVDLFEVCSPGEFRICERVSVPMEKIVLSGVYKNPSDIRLSLIHISSVVTVSVPARSFRESEH